MSAAALAEFLPGADVRSRVPALQLTDVRKGFEKSSGRLRWPWVVVPSVSSGPLLAVDDVSLTVDRGEILGILGANGSGKSTLIRLISTLLIPDAGSIRVFGLDLAKDERAIKRLMNRVSVDAAFFKKLSPMENLLYAARLYSLDVRQAQVAALAILQRLGISDRSADRPMEHMSRGMQQKVSIARALLTSPVLLLLDEPTTGLDPRSKKEVQQFVLEVRDRHEATVVLTTHDMDEADRLCDRVAVLSRGRVIALDTPARLKASYSHSGVAVSLEDAFLQMTGLNADEVGADHDEDAGP